MSRLHLGALALLLAGCHLIYPFDLGEAGSGDAGSREAGSGDAGSRDAGPADAAPDARLDLRPRADRGSDTNVAQDSVTVPDGPGAVGFSVALGGAGFDALRAIAADAAGNLYLAGSYASPVSFGGVKLPATSGQDAIVISLTPAGKLRWFRALSGTGPDLAHGVAHWGGRVFVTGTFEGQLKIGTSTLTGKGLGDAFVVGLGDKSGGVIFARSLGGKAFDTGRALAATNLRLCVVGYGGELEDDNGAQYTGAGGTDAFVALYHTTGQLSWVRRIGGAQQDMAHGVALDAAGNCVVGGSFSGTITLGSKTRTSAGVGNTDALVARLSVTNHVLGSASLGSTLGDAVHSVTYAGADVVISGTYAGAAAGVTSLPKPVGNTDIFVVRLDPGLTKAHWSNTFGSAGTDVPRQVAVDGAGRVVVSGQVQGALGFASTLRAQIGLGDGFLARLSAGGAQQWLTGTGAPGKYAEAWGVAAVGASTYYLAGRFDGALKGVPLTSAGGTDGFVIRYDRP